MRVPRKRYLQDCLGASGVLGLAKTNLGHESLLDTKILHQDILVRNILLYKGEDDGFDLAVKIDRKEASGAPSKT
jgi:hypothetical protein